MRLVLLLPLLLVMLLCLLLPWNGTAAAGPAVAAHSGAGPAPPRLR
jgi:hypothetical protein